MKGILFAICILFSATTYAQDCDWAISCGGSHDDYANSIVTDNSNNVYVVGYFNSPSMVLDSIRLINADSGLYASADMFIAKFDSGGHIIWAHNVGVIGNEIATSVAIDSSGNIYVTGNFSSPAITFGSITITNINPGPGSYDVFVAKYDPLGNVIWAVGFGGSGGDFSTGITTDLLGDIYVSGYYSSDNMSIGTTTLTNSGANDIFLVKLNSSGSFQWAKSAGGDGFDQSYGICADQFGNVFVTGSFNSYRIYFDSIMLMNSASWDSSSHMFLVKYDNTGRALWAQSAGANTAGNCVTVDKHNNIYLAGDYNIDDNNNGIKFDTVSLSNSHQNIFLAKYTESGGVVYAKSSAANYTISCEAIAIDKYENIYLAGSYWGYYIYFDTIVVTPTIGLYEDLYYVSYDSSGHTLWAKSRGGYGSDYATCLSTDLNNNIYVGGYFNSDSIIFDSSTNSKTIINPTGHDSGFEMFLAKIRIKNIEESIPLPTPVSSKAICIFPNPTKNSLIITSALPINAISICNLLGQPIFTSDFNSEQVQIDVADLPAGLYFVKVNGTEVRKFVKE